MKTLICFVLALVCWGASAAQSGALLANLNVPYGLQVWIDADYGVTLTSTNATNVLDRSGNGRQAYQTTASAFYPGWAANQINGHAVFTFNGTSNFFNWNVNESSLKDDTRTKITILFTVKNISTSRNTVFSMNPATQAGFLNCYTPYNDGNFYFDSGNQSTARLSGAGNLNAFRVAQLMRDGANMYMSTNGTQVATSSSKSGTNTTTGAMFIGGYGGVQDFLNGQLQEIMVWNRVLSTNEVAAMRKRMELRIGAAQN